MTTPETTALQATPEDDRLNYLMREAEQLARSSFVPAHYRDNFADCLIAIQWANRSGRDPLELLQNTYPISGNPGMYTRYMLALERRAKIFDRPVQWDITGEGEGLVVTCYGVIDGERYEASASMAMARAEKWDKNPKYKTMPEHMLRWRSATFLIRFTAPDVLLGMSTVEELQDLRYAKEPKKIGGAMEALDRRARGETEIVESPVEKEAETQESPAQEPAAERCEDCGAAATEMHEEYCPSLFTTGEGGA